MTTAKTRISTKQVLDVKRRRYARNIASKAIKSGLLKRPCTCESCVEIKSDIECHHIDYGKPLDVVWLCKKCHGRAHRKNSALNPNNNTQTPIPYIFDKHERVNVTFTIPIENFIHIRELAKKQGKPLSKMIEKEMLKNFPVQSDQLEFNFEVRDDVTQYVAKPRVQSMAKNEGKRPKTNIQGIQEIRGVRDYDLSRMGELFPILSGHGIDAGKLQRVGYS